MHDYRVASRYAKSLLLLAVERNLLEKVHGDIRMFSELCGDSRELVLLLQNPIVKHERKRAILGKIFEGKVEGITMAFFDIICRKNREKFLVDIAREFHHQYNVHNGIESATVITTTALTDDLRKEFERILIEISGKKSVEIEEKIDTDLLGGFILKVGDQQIDDSLSGKLNALRKQLIVNV